MIPDNKEFYINLWAKIKKYGPLVLLIIIPILMGLPFAFEIQGRSFFVKSEPIIFGVLFSLYYGFVMQATIVAFFTNKKWFLKVFALFLWGATCYWTFSVLIISVAMYLHGRKES